MAQPSKERGRKRVELIELRHKAFLVCLVAELMLVAGIVIEMPIIILESGICSVFRCPMAMLLYPFWNDVGDVLLLASAVGFAIGLPLVWRETTPSGTAS